MKQDRQIDPDLELPLTFLRRYLFYLYRRPVSTSNSHFRSRRINALKSLTTLLENRCNSSLERISGTMRALTEANLIQLAAVLEQDLRSMVPLPLPRDLVISHAQPSPNFLRENSRTLVAFGPAIGIGDETICFPIPAWLKQLGSEITILTAYPDLWERLGSVYDVRTYSTSRQFIEELRGIASSWDFVLLIDFENPGLITAMSREIGIPKYAEISLGIGSVTALDRHRSHLHRMPPFDPYFQNIYYRLDHVMDWLGLPNQQRDGMAAINPPINSQQREFFILVSPFTSKFEPSQTYWSGLLEALLSPENEISLRFQIDTGPNQITEAFALALIKIARANAPAEAHFELVKASRRYASLKEMFDCLEQMDLVIAADSYLAHAAPLFGVPAFIVARDGVESWRVPGKSNFYFRIKDSIPAVASAMRIILGELCNSFPYQSRFSPRERPECRRLQKASSQVAKLLAAADPDIGQLREIWNECHRAYWQVTIELANWPTSLNALLSDKNYDYLLGPWPDALDDLPAELKRDSLLHMRNQYGDWHNSNLQKYLTGFSRRYAG